MNDSRSATVTVSARIAGDFAAAQVLQAAVQGMTMMVTNPDVGERCFVFARSFSAACERLSTLDPNAPISFNPSGPSVSA